MSVKATLRQMYRENLRLITTDRMLQMFMVGVFALLISIIVFCKFFGDFQDAELYYGIADRMISGEFSYDALGTDLSPLTLILLIPPRLFSPNADIYCILFSMYGFAFYMLGGHFMLKSCRRTGYSEKDAYLLLFLFFICSLSFMTLSTGPITSAFVIIALWFFHERNYLISFGALGLATMAGFYPILVFIAFVTLLFLHKELKDSIVGIGLYFVICVFFLLFPTWSGSPPYFQLPVYAAEDSYLGAVYSTFNTEIRSSILITASFALAIASTLILSLRMKTRKHSMCEAALISEFALITMLAFSPIYSVMFPIWIMMLFPMTQMIETASKYQKRTYGVLIAFSIVTLASETVVDVETTGYEAISILRMIMLVALAIMILKQCNELSEN